ncbi:uncharacterized protein LOC119570932 [Penaeus monodon]|uniref:uncharacterized protein LOC119570932 n=1 Tax=Penaeus monodon TaxID=6687 RepID=UPI0018A718E8|nr:uncharacterized protein LOC119570932 [Penaeus monodon]
MNVDVDRLAMEVHFHMPESDDFDDVETLEDYSVGLAASRVVSQEVCYVRRLVKSFEQQVAFIKGHQDDGMRLSLTSEFPLFPSTILRKRSVLILPTFVVTFPFTNW